MLLATGWRSRLFHYLLGLFVGGYTFDGAEWWMRLIGIGCIGGIIYCLNLICERNARRTNV